MVTEYGMSDRLGLVTYTEQKRPTFLNGAPGMPPAREYSEETARAIDEEISGLMREAHDRVREILTKKSDQLETLSATLLEKETLQGEELKELVNGRGLS
jgi:cell division protease FtsH